MSHIIEGDWWPDMLRDLANEDAWVEEMVVVAEAVGYDDPFHRGRRTLWSALVPSEVLMSLEGNLRAFGHEVETTGRPDSSAAGLLRPSFGIVLRDGDRRIECEPLVLGWVSANHTAMVLDPRFAMTYGLVPLALGDGTIHWDDPAAPEFDVAIVDPPSIYRDLEVSVARVRISRTHLQDYLSLRGLHLVQVYYAHRTAENDEAIRTVLGTDERRILRFSDREIDVRRNNERGFAAQVWGARHVASPGPLPLTTDDLDVVALRWPSMEEPVTRLGARRLGMNDEVYVHDTVLGAYEGRPGFDIHPETGSVSFGGQWSIGFSQRIGRDVIALEPRKLYEGVPDRIVRHWHSHAVAAPPRPFEPAPTRNVAIRSKELVHALVAVGESLSTISTDLGLVDRTGADFVGLDRSFLEHHGWWNGPFVEPITRHIPIDMGRDAFLDRCLNLDKLVVEALAERQLRALVRAVGMQQDNIDGFRGLKLLDRVTCLAQVAATAGLDLMAGQEIVDRYHRDSTRPEQPLTRLFAISDLRQIKGHRKRDEAATFEKALGKFGIEVRAAGGGWGGILDRVYDGLVDELTRIAATLAQAAISDAPGR